MAQYSEKFQKIIFSDYYSSLETETERTLIRDFFVPKYMCYSTFYNRMRANSWMEYDFEKLEEITKLNFR